MQSEEFVRNNPYAKMPALLVGGATDSGSAPPLCIYESQVILEYLADKHKARLSVANPDTIEKALNVQQRALAKLAVRVHGILVYIASPSASGTAAGILATQGLLYKLEMPVSERLLRVRDLWAQLDALERIMRDAAKGTEAEGDPARTTFLTARVCSLADFPVFATLVWLADLVPRHGAQGGGGVGQRVRRLRVHLRRAATDQGLLRARAQVLRRRRGV